MFRGKEELAGKKVVVIGLASTGVAVANFLAAAGSRVMISEMLYRQEIEADLSTLDDRIELEFGGHSRALFHEADLIIPSPGVPRNLDPLRSAAEAGIPVLSEIELAAGMIEKPLLATTGTNGKSTVVSLLGEMLAAGGYRAPVVGNIGRPLITMVGSEEEYDCLVIEVSSFQLEWIDSFSPKIAAILNVTADHLDRYDDFGDYLETKLRIAEHQGSDDFLVLNHDDPLLLARADGFTAPVIFFSHGSVEKGVFRKGDRIYTDLGKGGRPIEVVTTERLKLQGVHNIENVMAAAAQALAFGASIEAVRRAAEAFEGLAHRNELVAEINGIRYFDDSKATNVGAVKKSLEGFSGPLILIAGGREKGATYEPLSGDISKKVKLLILIGEAREKMKEELGSLTETVEAGSLEEAVWLAEDRAEKGDVILLSPACSSFDMFCDYKHRGAVFRQAIRRAPCRER